MHDARFLNETFVQLILFNDIHTLELEDPSARALIPRIYEIFRIEVGDRTYNAMITEQLESTLWDHVAQQPYSQQYSWLKQGDPSTPIDVREGTYNLSDEGGLTALISQMAPGTEAYLYNGKNVAIRPVDPSVKIEDILQVDYNSTLAIGLGFDPKFDVTVNNSLVAAREVRQVTLDIVKRTEVSVIEHSTIAAFAMYQIGKTLEFLFEKRKYNHNDLKLDNVMIKSTGENNSNGVAYPQFYLIDFGLSRLEYNGFVFSGKFPTTAPAVPSADLLFFAFHLFYTPRCDEYFIAKHHCKTIFDPTLTDALSALFDSVDHEIFEKFQNGEYSRRSSSGWHGIYLDAHNSHGRGMFAELMNIAIVYLRSVAKPGYREPAYFGKKRRHRHRRR